MKTICGANCDNCGFRESCKGCTATCGQPFGGKCVAAEYIKAFGKDAYDIFKAELLAEINAALEAGGLPQAGLLTELPGSVINLEYSLPSGASVRLLDDQRIYLGCQIPSSSSGFFYGAAADTEFFLICRYGMDNSSSELLLYQKRQKPEDLS